MRTWETLKQACLNCTRCKLANTRTHVVVGNGNQNADVMLIGEGPGEQEDRQGIPFVGPAGQLLDKMLLSIGLERADVYVANIVKCRPPGNRDPAADEKEACMPFLRYQTHLVQPKIIVCLGRIAAQALISPDFKITKEHGVWYERKGFWMIATYHPSALLRDPMKKRPAYEDLKLIRRKIDEICPPLKPDGQ